MESNENISKILHRIARLYTNSLSQLLAGLDIDRYFDVLLTLSAQCEPVTQKTLAALMHIDKSRIVTILDYLNQKGYILVEQNPKDRRKHFISLSEKGRSNIPSIKDAVRKNDDLMVCGIRQNVFANCLETLSVMETNLKHAIRRDSISPTVLI
ncbi:MAG: MarR family transcriptional regulator [Bacteroidota bacterium]